VKKFLPVILLIAGIAAAAASCKQGAGERCQVASDCKSGECNIAQGVCVGGDDNKDPFDAELPPDAPDGPPQDMADAAADATTD